MVHHGSPILHHGYVHLGKYIILGKKVYMKLGIINHDKWLTSLIFHYIQGLPRRKCPRRDSNPGGECKIQISQPPKLIPMDIYMGVTFLYALECLLDVVVSPSIQQYNRTTKKHISIGEGYPWVDTICLVLI